LSNNLPSICSRRPFKRRRRSFATAQLSDEKVQAIAASRMDERHAHLDAVLEPN
jgi:hypothetical protein